MLARVYNPKKHSVVGWWASEKLDGIRALWDGKSMVTRQGYEVKLPTYLAKILPVDTKLDGELFFGRGKFPYTGLLRRNVVSDSELRRAGLKYMVFDVIDRKLNTEARHELGKTVVRKARTQCKERVCPLRWVTQTKIKSDEHMAAMLRDIVAKGGEGLMIKRPYSLYEHKRTDNLLKLKPVKSSEGIVVGYKRNKEGIIGSIKLDWGSTFLYAGGLTDAEKRDAKIVFPLGSRMGFSYNDVTQNGVPRHPRYRR